MLLLLMMVMGTLWPYTLAFSTLALPLVVIAE
jgi:hypothetical protein